MLVFKKRILQVLAIVLVFGSMFWLSACTMSQEQVKLRDLEFTVLSTEKIPEQLLTLLQDKKTSPFQITYTDQENLYLCIGYGEQPTNGYSIVVDELYLTETEIHVGTSLLGPSAEDKKSNTPSYPIIVMKVEKLDQPVVFE